MTLAARLGRLSALLTVASLGACVERAQEDEEVLQRSTSQWAERICDKIIECDCAPTDRSTCVREAKQLQRESWDQARALGLELDLDCLEARAQALEGLSCTQHATAADLAAFDASMCAPFGARAELGERCDWNPFATGCVEGTQCAKGFSTTVEGNSMDVCVPVPDTLEEGDPCIIENHPSAICPPSAVCQAAVQGESEGTCVRAQAGDACVGGQCGLDDAGGRLACDRDTDTCVELRKLGEACSANRLEQCADSLCNQGTCTDNSWALACQVGDQFGLLGG